MTTSGKEPEPEAEKNAGLFADVLEYREAIAALAEFGPGFEVLVARRWAVGQVGPQDIAGGPTFAGAVSEEPGKAP